MNFKNFFLILIAVNGTWGTDCDSNELNCISCTEYRKCIEGTPAGSVISCNNGSECNDFEINQCKLRLNCYEAAGNECLEAGIFPDALLETNFYVCIGDPFLGFTKYDFSCGTGYYFDKVTIMCVPQAATATTMIPTTTLLTTTTTTTTPSPPPPLPTTTTTTTTTLPPPTTTTSAPNICIGSGIFSFPSNCKMYVRCSTSLKAFYFICPGTSYFNENLLKCSTIISPTCQEQILKNTTTTSNSALSTSTTPMSPLPTIITSSSTSLTQKTSSAPFTCLEAGTFENPVSCKSYYRCTTTGKVTEYFCPGSTYYDEFKKLCTLEMTPKCKNLLLI